MNGPFLEGRDNCPCCGESMWAQASDVLVLATADKVRRYTVIRCIECQSHWIEGMNVERLERR